MRNLTFGLLLLFLCSCSTTKWVAPPYTSVNEMSKLKKGMSIEQVNSVLGIPPYDLYTIQEDGSTILLYNYRLKDRRASMSADDFTFQHKEEAQKAGEPWYGEASIVFVLFKDGKLSSLITNSGRDDAEMLLLINNNIQLISREELVTLSKQSESDYLIMGNDNKITPINLPTKSGMQKGVVVPFNKVSEKKPRSKDTTVEQKKSPVGKIISGILLGGLAIALIAAISSY